MSGQASQNEILKDSGYVFKAKLSDNTILTPNCGILAFAVAKKFKIIESENKNLTGKFVIIIIQCPELYGSIFFINSRVYSIEARKENVDSLGGIIHPKGYKKKKLPIFWARNIQKL
jgi:hypothetical protein